MKYIVQKTNTRKSFQFKSILIVRKKKTNTSKIVIMIFNSLTYFFRSNTYRYLLNSHMWPHASHSHHPYQDISNMNTFQLVISKKIIEFRMRNSKEKSQNRWRWNSWKKNQNRWSCNSWKKSKSTYNIELGHTLNF